MQFDLELNSSCDWATTPARAVITLPDSYGAVVEGHADHLRKTEAHSITTYWGAEFELLNEDGTEFDNDDLRIQGCAVKVYQQGLIQFVFDFKHSADECWTEDVTWPEGAPDRADPDL